MGAIVQWFTLAAYVGKVWGWLGAVALVFLTSLSRLYFAVHYPHDIIIGWLCGVS